MIQDETPQFILASKSPARKDMLRKAGVPFEAVPANIDEAALRADLDDDLSPSDIAAALSLAKALSISAEHPDKIIIGSDQVLVCESKMLSKAKNENEAREKLKFLRNKTHHLISAVCVVQGEKVLFAHSADANLTMDDFDDAFLEQYIMRAGKVLTSCVGAYAIEKIGSFLFKEIKGDYHVILGMPLKPLLRYLNENHALEVREEG